MQEARRLAERVYALTGGNEVTLHSGSGESVVYRFDGKWDDADRTAKTPEIGLR